MAYLCWVDGYECSTKAELIEHMQMEHEHGVHYIKCPICGDLILDTLLHFMNMHSDTPIPSGTHMRVTCKPKDYKKQYRQREIKNRRRRFKQGFFESQKNGCQLQYRSSWEEEVYKILERAFSVKAFKAEPFSIPYYFSGTQRNYWPDILIKFIDDTVLLVEVKPMKQCPDGKGKETYAQAMNDAKWSAAKKFCDSRKFDFVVWTENAIKHLKRLRAEQLTKNELMK